MTMTTLITTLTNMRRTIMTEKNRRKEQAKKQRVLVLMNTGTRTHKTDKYPSRQQRKQDVRKEWV